MLGARHVMHAWAELLDFASADEKVVSDALGKNFLPDTGGARWQLVIRGVSKDTPPEFVPVQDLKEMSVALREAVGRLVGRRAPFLTVRNHEQLCKTGGMGRDLRTYCLVLVDSADSDVERSLKDLDSSRDAYAQELKELQSSSDGEEVLEEPFMVQLVRVTRSGSRFPWRPSPVDGKGFSVIWEQAKRSPAFLLELETYRAGAIKASNLKNTYQAIAYDELKLTDLPETLSMFSWLPDPEKPLSAELRRAVTTIPGAIAAYLILAACVAFGPELSLVELCASSAVSLVLLVILWPVACRQCIASVWPGQQMPM